MKKFSNILFCLFLTVSITACATPANDTGGATITITDANTTTTAATPLATNSSDNVEGTGGDGLAAQNFINHYKIGTIRNYLLDYVCDTFGSEKFDEVAQSIVATKKADPYAYTGASIHFWVHEFNISKEKFVECNNKDKAFYEENYEDFIEKINEAVFTDEEIDDIYNLTTAEFNQKYKASTAVVVGELIYNFNWLYKNDIDLWQKQNFTVAQLQEAVDNAKKTENFPQGIAEVVEKKLNDYIAAVGEA